jgi:plastocyanin
MQCAIRWLTESSRQPLVTAAIFALVALAATGCSTRTNGAQTSRSDAPSNVGTPPAAVQLDPCSAAQMISALETAIATPTASQASTASPTPATATPLPAPQEDRVGFPEGHQENFNLFYVYDRPENRQIRVACANEQAASVKPGEPFPYGSVLLFESWRAKQDASGNVAKDANGRLIREGLTTIFVMRKEQGFGEAYQGLRNGEWEYVAYRPDKSPQTPPQLTASCASCHLGAGPDKDWVFRKNLFFEHGHYGQTAQAAPNEVVISSMAFTPNTLSVKTGTTLKWINNDSAPHTITANDRSFDSGPRTTGTSFSYTFPTAGTFEYVCSIHPREMRARVQMTE